MEILEKGEFKAVGLQVLAEWEQLVTKMPEKWEVFKDNVHKIKHRTENTMMNISRSEEGGVYVQLICVQVDKFEDVPPEMTTLSVPAQKYIHHRHNDNIEKITESFGLMYDWAKEQGIDAGVFKIDSGYLPDGSEEYHDLYVKITE